MRQYLPLTATLLLTSLALAQEPSFSDLLTDLTKAKSARKAKRNIVLLGERGILGLVKELQRLPANERSMPRRRAALEVLASMRESATVAVPYLLKAVQGTSDPDLLHGYFLALQEIAPYANDKKRIHDIATERVPMLLRSEDGEWVAEASDMRVVAGLRTLARIEIDPAASLEYLIEELGHKNPLHREFAAILLGRRGPAARSAFADLRHSFELDHPDRIMGPGFEFKIDSTRLVQRAIAVALSRIDPTNPDAAAGLMIRLKQSSASDRIAAALALGQLGQSTRAVDALMLSSLDPDPRIAAESIAALGILGPSARRATGLLQRIARGKDKQLKLRAKAALVSILKVEFKPQK